MKKTQKSKKPTFYEFVKKIYGMTMLEYDDLNELQKKAVEIDYINRYGSIRWF